MKDSDCIAFLQWALPCLGHRWPGYRKVRRQVCKRVDRRIRALGLAGIEEYRALCLLRTPSMAQLLMFLRLRSS